MLNLFSRKMLVSAGVFAFMAVPALAATYYVRSAGDGGDDAYNGLAAVWDGTNGPKATFTAAWNLAQSHDNTIDVGAGTFDVPTNLPFNFRIHVVGAGSGSTTLNQAAGAGWYTYGGASGLSSATPTIALQDVTLTGGSYGLYLANTQSNIGFKNVVLGSGMTNSWLRANTGNTYTGIIFDNVIRQQPNTSNQMYKNQAQEGGTNPPGNGTQAKWVDLTWIGGTIDKAGNGTYSAFVPQFLGNTTVGGGLVWKNNPCPFMQKNDRSFYPNPGDIAPFPMWNYSSGTFTVDNATFQDNTGWGLVPGKLDTNTNVIVKNATFADTAAGNAQSVHVLMEVNPLKVGTGAVGTIVFQDTSFSGAGTTGISLIDDGSTTQARPIELKNVTFNDCATGLAITGSNAGNLWYIDPTQSNATISGGTLITGGRMTYYGDANLDGTVDDTDKTITQTNQGQYGLGWGGGDYNRDGVTDALDLVWFITAVLGDLNNDSIVNNQDIAPFVLALTDLPSWQAAYPGVDILAVGDINGDAAFNNQDIAPFVTLLTGSGVSTGETSTIPEPASLGLLAIGSLMLISRRRRA